MEDIHSCLTLTKLLGAAVYSADANSGWVDLQGYDAAEIALSIGVGGITFDATNKISFVLEHADATDQSDAATVTDADLLGVSSTSNGIVKALTAAHAAAAVYRFGYKGGRRYLRFTADFSGTHGTGTPISSTLIKGEAWVGPTANQA